MDSENPYVRDFVDTLKVWVLKTIFLVKLTVPTWFKLFGKSHHNLNI